LPDLLVALPKVHRADAEDLGLQTGPLRTLRRLDPVNSNQGLHGSHG
jgi:hypothetical protein